MKATFRSPWGVAECEVEVNASKHKIQLFEEEDGCWFPYATATAAVDGLKDGEVAVKDYSENEGMLQTLLEAGIVELPHRFVKSGWVTIPVCRLK